MNVVAKSRRMNSLMRAVDEKSRRIITCLFRERHAGIRELADLICAASDMEVLIRMREVINPKAQEVIGEPLVTFERSKIDPLTGEKIAFSWWLREELMDRVHDDGLDVIDEKSVLRVVASLPLQEENVEVEVKDDLLIILGKEYYREVPLFCPVEKWARKTLNNGVLEVQLDKVR